MNELSHKRFTIASYGILNDLQSLQYFLELAADCTSLQAFSP